MKKDKNIEYEKRIINLLKKLDEPMATAKIQHLLGLNYYSVFDALLSLEQKGYVRKDKKNKMNKWRIA